MTLTINVTFGGRSAEIETPGSTTLDDATILQTVEEVLRQNPPETFRGILIPTGAFQDYKVDRNTGRDTFVVVRPVASFG